MDIKFNLIIENPPYGSTGNSILKNIIDNVDFEDHICLLPLKDLTVETGNYVDFSAITTFAPHSFADADVLTHAFSVSKTPINNARNISELCALAFTVDRPMIKFMRANELRNHYAFNSIKMWVKGTDVNKSFIYQLLRTQSQHTCGMDQLETKSVANEYNFNNNVIMQKTSEIKNTICTVAGNSNYKVILFDTAVEKENFVKFYRENRNFINRLIVNQFIGVRDDSVCWPKVDWTKSGWTVEKILKDVANYTDDEVKAVLDTMSKDYAVKNDSCIERLFKEYL